MPPVASQGAKHGSLSKLMVERRHQLFKLWVSEAKTVPQCRPSPNPNPRPTFHEFPICSRTRTGRKISLFLIHWRTWRTWQHYLFMIYSQINDVALPRARRTVTRPSSERARSSALRLLAAERNSTEKRSSRFFSQIKRWKTIRLAGCVSRNIF